nr:Gfo/Idh/MocA family oxidoreductase [Clostridia bacterium]
MILAAEQYGVTLMCAYPVPYWDCIQELKKLVDSKVYGEPFQMSVWTEQLTQVAEGGWGATKRNLGGGQFFSHGCHYVDLILRFMGNPVSGIHMGSRVGTPWMEGEGTSNMVMTFESGAMAYHMGTWGARGTHHGYDFQIHCTKGMLEYDRSAGKIYLYQSALGENNPKVLYESKATGKNTQLETRHFLECCKSGAKPMTDARSALQGLRCIWRMYEAEQNGTIADLRGLGIDQECIIK